MTYDEAIEKMAKALGFRTRDSFGRVIAAAEAIGLREMMNQAQEYRDLRARLAGHVSDFERDGNDRY